MNASLNLLMNPKISVVINCFNRKEFIIQALKSVCSQSIPRSNYEIILIKNFNDQKIDRFVENNNIKGFTVNEVNGSWFEIAANNSEGDFISFLEDDDLMHPCKLEIIQSLIQSDKDIVYIHNKQDSSSSNFKPAQFDKGKIRYFRLDNNTQFRESLKNRYYFNLSSITIRKSVLYDHLPLLRRTNYGGDFLMFSFASISEKKMIEYDSPLTFYRIHFDSPANFRSKSIVEFESEKSKILPSMMNNWNIILESGCNKTVREYAKLRLVTTKIWLNLISPKPVHTIPFAEMVESLRGIALYPLFMLFAVVYYFDKTFHKASKKIYFNLIHSWIGWRLRENI